MWTWSQILNGVGIFFEGIGIVWVIKTFPSRQEHEEAESDEIIARTYGGIRHIYYEDLVKEFRFIILFVGLGLVLEFIATFI